MFYDYIKLGLNFLEQFHFKLNFELIFAFKFGIFGNVDHTDSMYHLISGPILLICDHFAWIFIVFYYKIIHVLNHFLFSFFLLFSTYCFSCCFKMIDFLGNQIFAVDFCRSLFCEDNVVEYDLKGFTIDVNWIVLVVEISQLLVEPLYLFDNFQIIIDSCVKNIHIDRFHFIIVSYWADYEIDPFTRTSKILL